MKKPEDWLRAIDYLKTIYPDINENDKQGFINGNFWNGIAKLMEDYALMVIYKNLNISDVSSSNIKNMLTKEQIALLMREYCKEIGADDITGLHVCDNFKKMKTINYKELEELVACDDGLNWFKKTFGIDGEATFDDLLKCNNYKWINWLIAKVPNYQTDENLQKYLAMCETDYVNFRWLIDEVPNYQTDENLQKYLAMCETDYVNFRWLIAKIPNYQTDENLQKYLEMNKTDYSNFSWLIAKVPNYQTDENYELLSKMKDCYDNSKI